MFADPEVALHTVTAAFTACGVAVSDRRTFLHLEHVVLSLDKPTGFHTSAGCLVSRWRFSFEGFRSTLAGEASVS